MILAHVWDQSHNLFLDIYKINPIADFNPPPHYFKMRDKRQKKLSNKNDHLKQKNNF